MNRKNLIALACVLGVMGMTGAAFAAAAMRIVPALDRVVGTLNGVRSGQPSLRTVAAEAGASVDLVEVPGALEIPAAVAMAGRLAARPGARAEAREGAARIRQELAEQRRRIGLAHRDPLSVLDMVAVAIATHSACSTWSPSPSRTTPITARTPSRGRPTEARHDPA